MKNKLKIFAAAFSIIALAAPNIYAASNISYDFKPAQAEYKVLLDGQSYQIPDEVTFANGTISVSLETYKENLQNSASQVSTIDYDNGLLTFKGGVTLSRIANEYVPIVSKSGNLNDSINYDNVKQYFEKYQLLNKLKSKKVEYENSILQTTDENELKKFNAFVSNYEDDIERIENLKVTELSQTIYSSIPYLAVNYTFTEGYNSEDNSVSLKIAPTYYLYSIIFRDLRLSTLQYSINSNNYVSVPNFDKDTYTYTIKLPSSVADNATITTKSKGYMDNVLQSNNYTDYDLDLEVIDDTIELKNGTGTAKVKVVYDMYGSLGENADTTFSTNPEREYTIYFTKYDFLKGDLDRNGAVNANDAAVALDLYKYGNATDEDMQIGDMNEDGVINANDAALILDVYKYGY